MKFYKLDKTIFGNYRNFGNQNLVSAVSRVLCNVNRSANNIINPVSSVQLYFGKLQSATGSLLRSRTSKLSDCGPSFSIRLKGHGDNVPIMGYPD